MYIIDNHSLTVNVLIVSALMFQAVHSFKYLNWYIKDQTVKKGRYGEGLLGSVEWYEAVDNDSQRYSIQLDSSNVDPTDVFRYEDPRFTTTPPPVQPTSGLCNDLIPPDENVTLGEPPLPSSDNLMWVKPSWLHLKSMLLELAPVKNYSFQGYVVQIRYNNTPIGRFRLGGSRLARGVQCPGGGPNNTVYYYREWFLMYRALEWVPPKWFIGNVHNGTIHVTVIHRRGQYWMLTNTTKFFPYHNTIYERDLYVADRQFFRTFLPKFYSFYTAKIQLLGNATIPPVSYRPRLKEILLSSPYESQRQFSNISGFPW